MTLDDLDRRIHCPKFLSIPNYLRKGQSYGLQIWPVRYIDRVHPNKSTLKILEKREPGRNQRLPNVHRVHLNKSSFKISEQRERGRIQELRKIFITPYYLRNGQSYRLQIWPVNIQMVHPNKSPFKISEQRDRAGRIHGLPKVFEYRYPLLSQKRVKLQTSNLAGTFTVHPNKRRLKPVEKRGVGVYRDCPNFLGTPYYLGNMKSYELQILYALLYDRLQQTPIKNFRKSSHGCNHGLPKIFRASIYRAHRAVIFAIARLSCYKIVTYTAVVLSFLQSSIRKLADVWSEHRNLNEAIMSNMLVVYR